MFCAQSTDNSIFSFSLITQRWIQGSREESRYSKVQGWIWGGFPGDIQDSGRDSGFREGFRIQGGIQDSGRESGFRDGIRERGIQGAGTQGFCGSTSDELEKS